MQQVEVKSQTYYLMSFNMLNQYDIELLSSYKQFVESTIIELGEDWRIQSGLLSQQIVSIMNESMAAEPESPLSEKLQFNIFNQFLLPYLRDKLGLQTQTCQVSDSTIQENYSSELDQHFQMNSKITKSLTFKTLSLGFCIKAADMWVKSFSNLDAKQSQEYALQPLGILQKQVEKRPYYPKLGEKSSMGTSTIRNNMSNMDLGSNSQMQESRKQFCQKKWFIMKDLSLFMPQQLGVMSSILKNAKFSKTQVLSNFAVNIHQLHLQCKNVRILSTNSDFYRVAFIVWLIFNIKLFFSVSFEQYLIYFQKLIKWWKPDLEVPLKKFYSIIEKQWSSLLKDYSVALHDDKEVLKVLIKRVKGALQQEWKTKQDEIYKKLAY